MEKPPMIDSLEVSLFGVTMEGFSIVLAAGPVMLSLK